MLDRLKRLLRAAAEMSGSAPELPNPSALLPSLTLAELERLLAECAARAQASGSGLADGVVFRPAALLERLPEETRRRLSRALADVECFRLPARSLELGLRLGRVSLPWRELAAAAEPGVDPARAELPIDTVLELPLDFIVPLYLAQAGLLDREEPGLIPHQLPDLFYPGAQVRPPEAESVGDEDDACLDVARPRFGTSPESLEAAVPAVEPTRLETEPCLKVSLSTLMSRWPDSLRAALARAATAESEVCLPAERVELQMKAGRVTFSWGELQSWITPPLRDSTLPLEPDAQLEVPILLLARPYLAWLRSSHSSLVSSPEPKKAGPCAAPSPEPLAISAFDHAAPVSAPSESFASVLRGLPGVEAVFVTDASGAYLSGTLPTTCGGVNAAGAVARLCRQVADAAAVLGLQTSGRLLIALGDRLIVTWRVANRLVAAVARAEGAALGEFLRRLDESSLAGP